MFTDGGANPAGMNRLVRVMASQAANVWVAQQILEYEDAYLKTDALAIAPYFGAVPQAGPSADAWTSATWDQRMAMVEAEFQTSLGYMDEHADLLQNTTNSQGEKTLRSHQTVRLRRGPAFRRPPQHPRGRGFHATDAGIE